MTRRGHGSDLEMKMPMDSFVKTYRMEQTGRSTVPRQLSSCREGKSFFKSLLIAPS